MRVKICGITKAEQGNAIAQLGATALGFICVPNTPRYIAPEHIAQIIPQLPPNLDKIGVFVNLHIAQLCKIVKQIQVTGIQLHGDETPEYCQQVRQQLPNVELIKVFRIKNQDSFAVLPSYLEYVDTFLFDAYHPQKYGGVGKPFNWDLLQQLTLEKPWFLSGGLNPDNILEALEACQPKGIDLSSGVERSPGDKDIKKVEKLFQLIINY